MSETALTDETGRVIFRGTQSPGGGSQPGALQSAEFVFTEEATAGTYTATHVIAAGGALIDAAYWLEADWAADTATLDITDTQGDSIISGEDVHAGNHFNWVSGQVIANGTGPYIGSLLGGVFQVDNTITLVITTTIAVPPVVPTGIVRVRLLYFDPLAATAAVFA